MPGSVNACTYRSTTRESHLVNLIEADTNIDGDELALRLRKAIASLPEKQRLVFNMRYFDEMKYEQMSEILGTSVGALKASYHHAAKKSSNILPMAIKPPSTKSVKPSE